MVLGARGARHCSVTGGALVAPNILPTLSNLGKGSKKKRQIIHFLWIRGVGGHHKWISEWGGKGSPHVDKKFLNGNIINFKKMWISLRGGGGGQCG